jgi:hypothetical protein
MSEMRDSNEPAEIPWKPPVIAAIVGALLVAVFVIFAIVTGPVEDPEADALLTQPVPSKDVPPGYVALSTTAATGIRVESVSRDRGSSTVVVSSAVQGTTDPADSPPPDVAYWEIGPEGARVPMEIQFMSNDARGTMSIEFAADIPPLDVAVVAYPAREWSRAQEEVVIDPAMLGEPIAVALEVDQDAIITGLVTVGDGWGYVEWNAPEDMVATFDVVVTFTGTQNRSAGASDPIRLVPSYDPALSVQGTVITPRPLWGHGGSYGLYGDRLPLTGEDDVTSIVIAIEGSVVTATADPVVLETQSDDS